MSRFRALLVALLVLPAAAAPAYAAAPDRSSSSEVFTLADAIFEYENFDVYDGDCGDFVLLVDYRVTRDILRWPDREIRHVRYQGHFYNASDTSKSIVRNGNFTLTLFFGENGDLASLTRVGLFEYVVIDGRRVPTIVGRETVDFSTLPPDIVSTPHAGGPTPEAVCAALR